MARLLAVTIIDAARARTGVSRKFQEEKKALNPGDRPTGLARAAENPSPHVS